MASRLQANTNTNTIQKKSYTLFICCCFRSQTKHYVVGSISGVASKISRLSNCCVCYNTYYLFNNLTAAERLCSRQFGNYSNLIELRVPNASSSYLHTILDILILLSQNACLNWLFSLDNWRWASRKRQQVCFDAFANFLLRILLLKIFTEQLP